MKKFYLALAAVAAIFAGCSKEVDNQTEPVVPNEKAVTLKASVSGLETKVSSDNAGFFKWQGKDKITVVTSTDEIRQFSVYEIEADGTEADFSGYIPQGDALKLAMYPASEDHLAVEEELCFHLDDQVTWNSDATNMPMLGLADTGTSVQFFAVGGVLKLVLFNIPAEADYLQFCAASQQISGEFHIANVYADDPVIVTTDANVNGKDKELLIDFSEDYSSSKVFYIPLPTGDIEGFTVNLLDDEYNELFSVTSGKTLNVVANKLIIAKAMNCASPETVLSEVFDAPGSSTETVADYDKAGQTAYSGAVIDYSLGEGNQNTKIYQNDENSANTAGGAAPGELFLAKKASNVNGVFTITGIPTNVSNTLTLSFKSNQNGGTSHAVTTSTEGVTVGNRQVEGDKPYTISYAIGIDDNIEAETFDLIFTNSSSSNARIDDILVQVAGQSFTAPVITADAEELTFAVGETSKEVTVSLANPVDGLGIGALITGENKDNFTATIDGETLTVTALAPNPTDAAYTATVTLRASGAAAKAIAITQESALVPNLTNLKAVAGDASAEITWTGSDHATTYVAYLCDDEYDDPANNEIASWKSIEECSLSIDELENGTTYYLYVKVDEVEEGYASPDDFVMVSFTPAAAGGAYYEKVTSELSDWSGQYLIVFETNNVAFDGSLDNLDSTPNTFEVTIDNARIESTATVDAKSFTIAPMTGGYSILASNGKYIGRGTNSNGLDRSDSELVNTIEWSNDNPVITGAGGRVLGFNNDANQKKFRYLGSPAAIQLYKLSDNDGREEAGMSWSVEEATATYSTGNTLSFTAPTLNLGNASNISFASTNEAIATITATGAVTIEALDGNVVTEGSTTIKAIFAGDDNYKPQTVSYTLSVVDGRDAVAAPTFSPAAGEVEAGDEVTINSVSGATVYYTVNGANPTTESTLYEGPITINEAKTIKAIAVLSGYKTSEVAEAAYTVAGVQSNDGTLEHPYTATDVLGLASASNVYVTGTIKSITEVSTSYHNATYTITDGESDALVFRGKYLNNANFTSEDQIAVGDVVIVYGNISQYNNVSQVSQNNYLYSINGKTKALTAGTLTATPDNDNKQITVEWGAATGTESAISYVVTCDTQSINATAAGSHTFTMADYGSYDVTVTASADDAISATASTSATLTDPSITPTTKEYTLTISGSDFNTTSYAANNNEKTSNAVAGDNSTFEVKWTSYQVMKNGNNMQWQKSKGYIYNSTDLGTIKSVTVNSSAGSFTTYYGTEAQPSSGTTVGNGFFKTNVGSATGTTSSVVIVFEK